MDKEALLKIIISDLNEVETLVKSFQGQKDIPAAFIDLTERKLNHISDEFSLLKTLSSPDIPVQNPVEKEIKKEKTVLIEKPVAEETHAEAPIETQQNAEEKIEIEPEVTETVPEPTTQTETPAVEVKEEQPAQLIHEPQVTEELSSTEPKKQEPKEDSSKTLGESFVGEKKSVNDLIANAKESKNQSSLIGKPVNDLTKGLGLNDRFLFQRELFDGNADLMKQTLEQLNEVPDYNAAQTFISSNFTWDNENEATLAFLNYIKRRF